MTLEHITYWNTGILVYIRIKSKGLRDLEAIDLRLHFTHGSLKQRCRSRHAVQYGQLILTMCQAGEAADTYCVVFGLIRQIRLALT
jgi:hypothetical protein